MSVCYSISIADAVKNGYSLSKATKKKYRFINIAKFLDDQVLELLQFDAAESPGDPLSAGIPAQAQPYAALSYPWRDLTALDTSTVDQMFVNADIPKDTPTSAGVLYAVCTAAKQQGCKYLWMDKLCLRQDSQDEGKEDRTWQVRRMYGVYEKCKVCLVAPGGMVRLPRLAERTAWIDRAWTLQEALAPPEVLCLFVWKSGDREIRCANLVWHALQVLPDVGLSSLTVLLAMNLRADLPAMIKSKNYKGEDVDVAVLPDDPDSQVLCFGNRQADRWPIEALQGALDLMQDEAAMKPELSARPLGIWRCITMRNASYAEDFVFATMGIFGVNVEPLLDPRTNKVREASYPEDEIRELLDRYLKALSSKGLRADWFAVAPELGPARETTALPLVPDINYTKDKTGKPASAMVKSLLSYWDRFNWYLRDTLEYTVDAPNGIQVTARVHAVDIASVLPLQDSSKSSFYRVHDKLEFKLSDRKGDSARYAIVIGKKVRYGRASVPRLVGDPDAVLLMLAEYIPFTMQRFRNVGYAWVKEEFVSSWGVKTLGIGLRGG